MVSVTSWPSNKKLHESDAGIIWRPISSTPRVVLQILRNMQILCQIQKTFMFIPKHWRNDPIWRFAYFSNGWFNQQTSWATAMSWVEDPSLLGRSLGWRRSTSCGPFKGAVFVTKMKVDVKMKIEVLELFRLLLKCLDPFLGAMCPA